MALLYVKHSQSLSNSEAISLFWSWFAEPVSCFRLNIDDKNETLQ